MAIRIMCDNGHVLSVPDNLLGKRAKCPKCGLVVPVVQATGPTSGVNPPQPVANNTPKSQRISPSIIYAVAGGLSYFAVLILGGGVWLLMSVLADKNAPMAIGQGPMVDSNNSVADSTSSGKLPPATESNVSGDNANSNQPAATAPIKPAPDSETDIDRNFYMTQRTESKVLDTVLQPFKQAQIGNPSTGENFVWFPAEVRNRIVPFFLLTSEEEEKSLATGEVNPKVKKRIELLQNGMRELGLDGWGDNPKGLMGDAISDRFYADILAYKWRWDLMSKFPTLDEDKCKLIRKIEDSCFGIDSAFYEGEKYLKEQEFFEEAIMKMREVWNGYSAFMDLHNGMMPGPSGAPSLKGNNLSWRVAILPYINKKELYDEFHLNEPWDSEHNSKLIELMPDIFAIGDLAPKGHTTIHFPLLENGLYSPLNSKQKKPSGDDNLFKAAFVLCGEDMAEPWTKPGGIEFLLQDGATQFGKQYLESGYIYAIFNGQVRLLRPDLSSDELKVPFFLRASNFDYKSAEERFPLAYGLGAKASVYKTFILKKFQEFEKK